ncbi:hypothetical protein [Empedobacter sedimenti]|uniref:hypothetical protein n=1 Tax=Empedobacter sedimenti TaxID=3042610 RepID=UPI0024A71787|nr:hypothetical protein [Empedobacter sedimenti]
MCRYAIKTYKAHYACFKCQKTFKRKRLQDLDENATENIIFEAKCPQCSSLMADMGLDFEAPKKTNHKAWKNLENLYEVGITFHNCGCGGNGYVPKNKAELLAYLEKSRASYYQYKACYTDQQGFDYWHEQIKKIEEHIETVKLQKS